MECLPRHEHVSQESTLISLWCNDVDRKDFVDIETYTYYEGLPNLTLRLDTPPTPPPPCLVKKVNTVVKMSRGRNYRNILSQGRSYFLCPVIDDILTITTEKSTLSTWVK